MGNHILNEKKGVGREILHTDVMKVPLCFLPVTLELQSYIYHCGLFELILPCEIRAQMSTSVYYMEFPNSILLPCLFVFPFECLTVNVSINF